MICIDKTEKTWLNNNIKFHHSEVFYNVIIDKWRYSTTDWPKKIKTSSELIKNGKNESHRAFGLMPKISQSGFPVA